MCDDQTEAENEVHLRQRRIGRRELGVGAGAAAATWLSGCRPPTTSAAPQMMPAPDRDPQTTADVAADAAGEAPPVAAAPVATMVTIETPDGAAEAFFVTPAAGRHPAVLVWPDVAGLREAFEVMATRLAERGYAALVVNPYYRSSKVPVLGSFEEWRTEEGRAKIGPMREALTAEAVTRDGGAFVAWLDRQPQVDPARKVGTIGYCMGGPFTFRTAAAVPERVGAIGSFHGGGLVTEDPDSPHALLSRCKAAMLVCIADSDAQRQPEAESTLRRAAEQAGLPAEIEVYPTQHGWCVLDSPVYDEAEAERAWSRLLATLQAHL